MLSYLRVHFELLVMFDIVDESDDGLVSYDEFVTQLPKVQKWGVDVGDPRATFDEIDEDKRGTLDFDEFREWALLKSLELDDEDADDDADASKAAHEAGALHARH